MISRGSAGAALLAVFWGALACTPSASGPPEASPHEGSSTSTPADLREEGPKSEANRTQSPPALKLPPLCEEARPECGEFQAILRALDEGQTSRAKALLAKLSPSAKVTPAGLSELISGIALLESESMAYGEGGEAARASLALFEQASRRGLSTEQVDLQRSRAHLALGEGEKALQLLLPLAEKFRADAEVQAALGISYLSVGRVARSLEPLRLAARLDPTQPERFLVLGTAQMLVGDLTQAEANFRSALAINPALPRAHSDLGATLLIRGQISEGHSHLKKAAELSPDAATYVSNLSYAELLLKKPKEAKSTAERAIELDPLLVSAWINLGLAEAERGDWRAAEAAFTKAQKLDPSDPRPQNNLQDLKELEQSRDQASEAAGSER